MMNNIFIIVGKRCFFYSEHKAILKVSLINKEFKRYLNDKSEKELYKI